MNAYDRDEMLQWLSTLGDAPPEPPPSKWRWLNASHTVLQLAGHESFWVECTHPGWKVTAFEELYQADALEQCKQWLEHLVEAGWHAYTRCSLHHSTCLRRPGPAARPAASWHAHRLRGLWVAYVPDVDSVLPFNGPSFESARQYAEQWK